MEADMKKLIAPTTLIIMLVCASAALAHGTTVPISGIQKAEDLTVCAATDPETGGPAYPQPMTGSLIGCWYTDPGTTVESTADLVYVFTGTEHFVGCLDLSGRGHCAPADPTGSLALTYTFEAQYTPSGNEIWGRCQHGIVPNMGTGGFAGAAGWLDFTDNVTLGTSAYQGYITLAGRRWAARATKAAAFARVRRSKSMC
jgi:hypothetical protein